MNLDPDIAYISVILKEFGIPLSVSSKRERIALQKAIYLVQRAGLDLGYRYSWYLNGPYCSKLADVYYKADSEKAKYQHLVADANFKQTLAKPKALIQSKPNNVDLTYWLEALVSLDFLITVNKRPLNEAIARVAELKPHVCGLLSDAQRVLTEQGFLVNAAT